MIILQLTIAIFWCIFLARTSNLLLFFYAALALYSIVPQVGYEYFPELSIMLGAYFGESIISSVNLFFLSNLTLIPLALYLSTKVTWSLGYSLSFKGFPSMTAYWIFYGIYFGSMWLIYLIFSSQINYATASSSGGDNAIIYMFPIMNKIGIGLIILAFAYKEFSSLYKMLSYFLILSSIFFSFKLGARVDVLSLFMGLLMLHVVNRKFTHLEILRGLLLVPFVFLILTGIEAGRSQSSIFQMSFAIEDIIANDYLAPGHTIYSLIHFQYIDPAGQLLSGFLNSFPALPRLVPGEYPLLSETIGSMTSNGLVQMGRTQGYAFHLLGEGFIIMGMWGALYNFLALLFSFSFYKFLTNSLDPKGKEIFVALIATIIFPLIRSQYSYFLEFLFTYLMPIIFLHLLFYSNHNLRGKVYGS